MKGVECCSYWIRHSRYRLAFPACNAFAQITIHEERECLVHCHVIPYSTVSDQLTHITTKGVQQQARSHGICWSYHVSHHPEAAGLLKWWNGLLKS